MIQKGECNKATENLKYSKLVFFYDICIQKSLVKRFIEISQFYEFLEIRNIATVILNFNILPPNSQTEIHKISFRNFSHHFEF